MNVVCRVFMSTSSNKPLHSSHHGKQIHPSPVLACLYRGPAGNYCTFCVGLNIKLVTCIMITIAACKQNVRLGHTNSHNLVHIQGVSRLVDITAGGDFLDLCDQKISYKRLSDSGRLRSYGHFLIPVHALVWTALRNQLAGDVLNWWLIVCVASIIFATWLAHPAANSPVSLSRHFDGI